eukprot:CAMPEP_0113469172 /NCGR_PEP_ID=MMETSP0014_2-20120614/15756_1 /TAXON_ID=2857 /ORGANISM="Nitzschia sp." /LENGTH=913 /DNA_ID=CAMNT_0000361629 /DNA_START=92 /DNA_END=2830 /DNA_ORIENTATION=+ /assembly_acc=CAM_ASM_000159
MLKLYTSQLCTLFLVSSLPRRVTPDCFGIDDAGNAVLVTDCVCDESCDECGFYGDPVSGPEDCFSCAGGLELTELFDDGSGTCTVTAGGTEPEPLPEEELEPETPPADAPVGEADPGVCVIVFQMADNDLESYIRADLSEMTQSGLTQAASTVTWVYFDALNEGDPDYTGGPLAGVYNSDGTPLTESFGGSRYLRWDHDLGKMVVDNTLPEEQDSDSPAVLQSFLEYALTDCVAKGKTEYFLAFSSHGGGYAGFGYDNHERRRLTYQPPSSIRSAIVASLSSVPGAPSQLDVLGFDACLMQSMGAMDDFKDVTKYYLASEAVEPGHGWAYNELSATTSAMELGQEIVSTFVSSTQDYGYHDTPKTLALVDTVAYSDFLDTWEALSSYMADLLASGTDADFHAILNRARGNAISFAGSLDEPSVQVNAAMDIGSFMLVFRSLCQPNQSGELAALLNNAMQSYTNIFVTSETGPGTVAATGMHVSWVSKQEFTTYTAYYDNIVFGSDPPIIQGAPQYLRMLAQFYLAPTPESNAGDSVCGASTSPSRSATSPSELLIDPSINFLDDVNTEIRSEITRSTDFVFVEYGVDVTNWLSNDEVRRRLQESAHRARKLRESEHLEGNGTMKTGTFASRRRSTKWRYRDTSDRSRRTQQEEVFGTEDYFLLYGGDVAVEYDGPNIISRWDSTFFWIEAGESFEPVYAFDEGEGLKSIPVCYFGPAAPITTAQIEVGVTVADAVSALGCEEGFLSFSAAEDSDGQIGLYVYQDDRLSQVERGTGKHIVPILYIEYSVGEDFVDELLGGFGSLVIPWTQESEVSVYYSTDAQNLEALESNTAFMEIFAYDEDADVTDNYIFPYSFEGVPGTSTTDGTDTTAPMDGTGPPSGTASTEGSSSATTPANSFDLPFGICLFSAILHW